MNQSLNLGLIIVGAALLSGCQFEKSGATGWNYNDSKNGGFEKAPFEEQENGPGLILVEGGQFTMGRVTDGLLQLFSSSQPAAQELRNRGLSLVNHVAPLKRWLVGRALRS